MTTRLILTLALTALLAAPGCAADVDAPADPPSQPAAPAAAAETAAPPATARELTSLDVVDRVEGFYDRAWKKLIWFVGVIGGLVIVLVPLLLTLYQRRTVRDTKKDFSKKIASVGDDLRNEIERAATENAAKATELMQVAKTELHGAKNELQKDAANTRHLLLTGGLRTTWTLFRILKTMPQETTNAIAAGVTTINHCVALEFSPDTTETFIKELVCFLQAETPKQALARNDVSCQDQVRNLIQIVDRMEKTHSLRQLLGELRVILLNAQTGTEL